MDIKQLIAGEKLTVSILDIRDVNGEYLIKFRHKHGLSQVALANILRVSRYSISRWEAGKLRVAGSAAVLVKLLNDDPNLFDKVYKVHWV